MNIDIGVAIKWGWKAFVDNLGMLIVVMLATFIATSIPSFITSMIGENGSFLLTIPFQILSFAVNVIVGMVVFRIGLDIYDKGTFKIEEIFRDLHKVGNYLLLSVIMVFGIGLGYLLLIVPGVILSLMWVFGTLLVIDKGLPAIDALRKSKELTDGHKMTLFVNIIILSLLYMAGLLAFFVGIFVTGPVAGLAFIYIYRQFVPNDEEFGISEDDFVVNNAVPGTTPVETKTDEPRDHRFDPSTNLISSKILASLSTEVSFTVTANLISS